MDQGTRSSTGGWTSAERNCRSPGVSALVGQELDAGRCSGLILNFLTTFQYLVLDFVSTFHYLRPDFSSPFLIFGVSRAQLPLEKVGESPGTCEPATSVPWSTVWRCGCRATVRKARHLRERDAMLLIRPVNDPCTVFPQSSTVSTTNRIRDVTVSPRLFLGFLRTFHDFTRRTSITFRAFPEREVVKALRLQR